MAKVKETKIEEFRPQIRNANRHSQRGLGSLESSMRKHGYVAPMTAAADGEIIDGSARLETVANVFDDDVLVVEHDGTKPIVMVRTDIKSADSPEARAISIAANRIAELNLTWDAEVLLEDLQSGVDLKGLFNQDELDALLDGLVEKEPMQPAEAQVDKAAELQKLWNTQTGQLWQLGRHRLICGDCTDKATVERLMQGERAAMMFTDPPYGVDVAGGTHDPRDEKNYRSGGIVENDALTDAELEALLDSAFKIARSVMDKGAAYYVWHPSSKVELFARSIRVNLAPHREIIIWFKDNFVFGRQDYHWQHEPCFYGWIEGAHKWYGDRTQSTVWIVEKVGTDLEKKLHPTAKPIGLPEKALNNHTATSDIVYEPFCGSGTTLIACEQLNRQCRAVEISPAYCAVILQRYKDSTNVEPVLIDTVTKQ